MNYVRQKVFFKAAYLTGSDVWTNTTLTTFGNELAGKLSKGSLVLDVGSGRGKFAFQPLSYK